MSRIEIPLQGKASVPIVAHTFPPSNNAKTKTSDPPRLLVFLNGMVAPQMAWHPVIKLLQQQLNHPSPSSSFQMLTYDRFGQGLTAKRDPTTADTEFGSDLNEVVEDLHHLIQSQSQSPPHAKSSAQVELVLVGNSIGCAIARHYAATRPGSVAGVILLDSILANSDFVDDIFPDPQTAAESELQAPREDIERARMLSHRIFSPTLPNPQGFDRRNMAEILPEANRPHLVGPGDRPPRLIVVGHDPKKFAEESSQRMGIPISTTEAYTQPVWERYNQGLLEIGESSGKVETAPGCGHFVQLDDPAFVAEKIVELVKVIGWA